MIFLKGKFIKILLIVSLALNVIFLVSGAYFIQQKGGSSWLFSKFNNSGNAYKFTPTPFYLSKVRGFNYYPINNGDIVMLGDSLTDNADWNEIFPNKKIRNRGIFGDTTYGVLNRINQIDNCKPSKAFVMIGINDLQQGVSIKNILQNYKKIINDLKRTNARIYVYSVLPINNKLFLQSNPHFDVSNLQKNVIQLNDQLKKMCKSNNITYVDLYNQVAKDNQLRAPLTYDGIHLNSDGYKIWRKMIAKYIK
jgi:lysophospholipase L1-like esterase